MKHLFNKNKFIFALKKPNAFLLLLTGFFIGLFFLAHIIYAIHPYSGWATSLGIVTTGEILIILLLSLVSCLLFLWKSTATSKRPQEQELEMPRGVLVMR